MLLNVLPKLVSVQGLTVAHGLLFTFLATRFLDPETFGSLRYVMVLLPFFMLATLPSYDNLILRESSSGALLNLRQIWWTRGIFGLFTAITFGLIVLCIRGRFAADILQGLVLIIFLLPFYETTTGYKNYLIGVGLQKQILNIQVRNKLISIAILGVGILLVNFLEPTLFSFLLVFMLATTIPNFCSHAILVFCRPSSALKTRKIFAREAILTSFASGVWIASYSLDKIIVAEELGAEALAYYSILMLIPLMTAQLIDGLIPFYYKKFFFGEAQFVNLQVVMVTSVLFLLVIGGYGFLAYTLYSYLFGDFYTYTLTLALFSGVVMATGSIEFFFIHYLYKGKKSRQILAYNLMSLVIVYIALVFVVPSLNYVTVISVMGLKQLALPLIFFGLERMMFQNPISLGK